MHIMCLYILHETLRLFLCISLMYIFIYIFKSIHIQYRLYISIIISDLSDKRSFTIFV